VASPILSFELPTEDVTRLRAEEIADKTGEVGVVSDEAGEICRARPVRRGPPAAGPRRAILVSAPRHVIAAAIEEMRETTRRSRSALADAYQLLAKVDSLLRRRETE
jgi:hypothetical protein